MRRPPARPIPDDVFKDHKPSARGCEGRLRGLKRSNCSKAIMPTLLGPIFTLALHAAAPHNAAMNIVPGRAAPSQTLTRAGYGETRFPHTPRRGLIFTLAVHATPPHNAAMNIRLFLGGLRPPKPSQGAGPGCAGRRPASAEVWGNPVSPRPSPRVYVHLSGPCGSAAHRWDEHPSWEGVALPNPLTGWGDGETGFPHAPRRGRMFTSGRWEAR